MEAVVLAGGFGTRLKEVVPDLPKPMAPIAGRPFLEIMLQSLALKGFKRIILSLGYMADKIRGHFGNSYLGMDLVYEVEVAPLGTGGAARAALRHCLSDHVYIFNGDTFLDLEVAEIETLWRASNKPIIVVREVSDASRYGTVLLKENRVISFLEKGVTGLGIINAGCYVVPPNLLDKLESSKNFSLEVDFFYKEIHRRYFSGFVTQGLFIDIGVPEDFLLAQTLLAEVV